MLVAPRRRSVAKRDRHGVRYERRWSDVGFHAHPIEPEPGPAYYVIGGIILSLIVFALIVLFATSGAPPAH